MFGMSFYEIAIIAIVALVILGPEKLPEVARTAGKFLRQARQMSTAFRDTIMLEAELHEQKQKKPKPASKTPPPARPVSPQPSTGEVGSFDLDLDYDGPLDQLDDEYFHMHPPEPAAHGDRDDVALESRQMSDPFSTTEVELEVARGERDEPTEEDLARHLASPFDVHLVERCDVELKGAS